MHNNKTLTLKSVHWILPLSFFFMIIALFCLHIPSSQMALKVHFHTTPNKFIKSDLAVHNKILTNNNKSVPKYGYRIMNSYKERQWASCNKIFGVNTQYPKLKGFDDIRRVHLNSRKVINVPRDKCTQAGFFDNSTLPLTGLISMPGSGNTWTRHLIQMVTGIYTGTIYINPTSAVAKEFPGEITNTWDKGNMIVIKSHEADLTKRHFSRLILIIRDSMETFRAEFVRQHTPINNRVMYHYNDQEWHEFCEKFAKGYENFYSHHIAKATSQDLDLFLLFYEDLIHDIGRALVKVAYFLGVDLEPDTLKCALDHMEGKYHRPAHKEGITHLCPEIQQKMNISQKILRRHINKCLALNKCMVSGCGFMTVE